MIKTISKTTGIGQVQVTAALSLLEQGATIPFIARYRKEQTGSLDEVALADIRDRMAKLTDLVKRKETILKSLKDQGLSNEKLFSQIGSAKTAVELEDIYQPFRPKKKTRALVAKGRGLEPLARWLMTQCRTDPALEAGKFIHPEKEIPDLKAALAGARDILAEQFNDDPLIRSAIRRLFEKKAILTTTVKRGKKEEGQAFKDYFNWSEHANKAPSHRILAMLRGEKKGILTLHLLPPEAPALAAMERRFIKRGSGSADQIRHAIKDAYTRLIKRSLEKEQLKVLKRRADQEAIQVFTANIKELLLASPLGEKRVLAIDPGFRTGCKVVCLDSQGKLLTHTVIFPFNDPEKSATAVKNLVKNHQTEAIAIGNGTAGRETESFIRELSLPGAPQVIMVDESGASIYSASAVARDEFPDQDITVRGAVSIGRRLMDPLAELVKIDPRSIGVGQYQHDVNPKQLKTALDDALLFCVNRVGVELNTASRELLLRVSGLNAATAKNIIRHRNENGPFLTKKELLKVPRLGPKAFEQAAGFLRIRNGTNPLDRSGIHPESYTLVRRMARDNGCTLTKFVGNAKLVQSMELACYVSPKTGLPTLKDIAQELIRPGRDPRRQFKPFQFDKTIHDIKDLIPGMRVPGIVTNVTAFGAFVDIGVHQDGLVHISQLSNRFVKNPADVVKVRQTVRVTVLDVDIKRKRISLSMKEK